MEKSLSKHNFVLHSFLDKNIGSNKGNDILSTINDFLKYTFSLQYLLIILLFLF